MIAKRIAAVLAAVVLIVGAVMFRKQLDDDNDAKPTNPGGQPSGSNAPQQGEATIACVTDLAIQCRQIDAERDDVTIRIEDWSVTAKALADGTGPDGWITVAPLSNLGTFDTTSVAASTAMNVVVKSDRADALAAACGATPTWLCVGKVAGDPWTELGGSASWGKVGPGFADPTSSALGAVMFANANVGFFAGTPLGADAENFSSVDIDASDDHVDWFTRLAKGVPTAALADPLTALLQRPAVNIAAATSAQVAAIPDARAGEVRAIVPTPAGRIDAVVAGHSDRFDVAAVTKDLTAALTGAGWDAAGSGPDGIPSAQTVIRLRNSWQEARS
jgi:hypothetical protein